MQSVVGPVAPVGVVVIAHKKPSVRMRGAGKSLSMAPTRVADVPSGIAIT
ncbi:MAG: hypothetical protein [Siphoviridae sp. ctpQM7]|nr:MAG: hypothetical protein [Siphoviridae sp. ctpQM7]